MKAAVRRSCGGLLAAVALGLSTGVLSGCASTAAGVTKGVLDKVFEDGPAKVVLEIRATADLNADADGRPSPLAVRLYALSSLGKFEAADFFELYDRDEAVLGADLRLREARSFAPGERSSVERTLPEGSRYVAVFAAYRDTGTSQWRASAPVEIDTTTTLTVTLEGAGVSMLPKGR